MKAAEPRFRPPEAYTPKHLAERILTSKGALEGERKQVTVLFCDLANSTTLAARLGPETMHSVLNRFFELSLTVVHRYEGTVNQFLGDGFMALFGAPLAHEDHARRATMAALGIRRQLSDPAADLGHPGIDLAVRIGLNTGLVVVGRIGDDLRMDYTAVGDTTNVAARLQQLAEPGVILISEATARLVTGYVRVEALGPIHLKGKAEPVTTYKVVGMGPRRSPLEGLGPRRLSRFVGRDHQLADLHDFLGQVEEGQGQAVGIAGEPGMGKSRLLYEFRRSLSRGRVTYLEGRCLSYGKAIPYLPVLELVRNNCGISEADGPEVVAEKARLGLQEVGMAPDEWTPYLFHLLGVKQGTEALAALSPQAIKARTLETLRQMSLKGSRLRPIIFAVEDLHWIDQTSEEYFTSLVEVLGAAHIMLLCTYRPRYRPLWLEQSYATQIALHRLAARDSLKVVQSVLQSQQVPEHLARVILDKAEGNPFFLEELTQAVLEHGDVQSDATVPDTVQGVLMARIDRLPEEPRRVLQTAAVLGREFSLRVLDAIWEGPGVLDPHLLALKRLEFLYELAGPDEPVYVFKHALTQDVAYESLLVARRRVLHAAAGQALEGLFAERLEDAYDRLAYHYSRAGEASKAVEYLIRSADKAARVYANADAVKALEEAMVHVDGLPVEHQDRRRLAIALRLAHSLYFLGRIRDTLDLLLRHRERVERLADPGLAGPYYFWLSHTHSYLSEYEPATATAKRALDEATRCGDESTAGQAYYVLARIGFGACRYPEGVEFGRRAIPLLERAKEWLWLGQSFWAIGLNHIFMGEFDAALEVQRQAYAVGEAHGDPRIQTYADWASGWALAARGDCEAGINACTRSLRRSRDAVNTAAATGWLGYAHLEKGDYAEAVRLLERGADQFRHFEYKAVLSWFDGWLSEALHASGQLELAAQVAVECVEIGQQIQSRYAMASGKRVLGRIAQAGVVLPESQRHFDEALEDFVAIHSRFEAGRTHLDLAMLARAQEKPEAILAHLGEARALFTALGIVKHVERVEKIANDLGVHLADNASASSRT